MNLPLYFARRYLFARKSHNVINIISAISAIGMAFGTAALIIILSVYNGFDALVSDSLSDLDPDYLLTSRSGRVFTPRDSLMTALKSDFRVLGVEKVLKDRVFATYDGRQSVAVAKGVEQSSEQTSLLRGHVVAGQYALGKGELAQCAVGVGIAHTLGVNPSFLASLTLYYPDRDRNISAANPLASVESVSMRPSCTFSVSQDVDNSLIILPIETLRGLLGYSSGEVSGVEIRLMDGLSHRDIRSFEKQISASAGEEFELLDRYRQNESIFRMMKYEKAAIFLILIFIIIIIAFNIFGCLTMLIIEKEGDIATLRSMGATDKTIHSIFTVEGWLISLLGLVAGLVLGIAFALIQQHFGIIKMPGGFMTNAYPVVLLLSDVLITALGVTIVGYIIAWIPSRKI
jgi:ABC-type lipoprotein release transport system permease subunit